MTRILSITKGASGGGTVTTVSVVTANGISGSVANSTTTPAITLTLGAITPSTVNSVTISGSSTPTLAVTGTSSISGSNTGDQTITLTSDVTGSGTGSFATTIKSSVGLSGSPTTTTQAPADNSTKIATTAYVDNAVLGQDFKQAVVVATTTVLASYVYNNGSSGVGATITAVATGVISFDGTALTAGIRVLVKNETSTNTPNNGIYTVTVAGALGVALVLTRATDFDQSSDIDAGDSVFVTSGTTQGTTTWAYNGISNPTIGTTNITFAQTAGQGSFTAGNGISITGVSIAIDTSVTVDKTTAQTLTNKSLTTPKIASLYQDSIGGSNLLTMPAATDTLIGKATTDTLTNKTYDTAGTGNTFKINGTGISAVSGTGAVVLVTSATLITPALGTPSALVATNATGTAGSLTSGITQALASASTTVNVSSATAPSSGQVLTATSSTAATWQTPSGGGMTWNNVTGTSQSAAINNGYIANNAGLCTITLPSTAAVGSIVGVAGSGAGGWKLAQNASQVVNFGSAPTTSGTGGSLASVNQYDAVEVICIAANTTWAVLNSQGNLTVT